MRKYFMLMAVLLLCSFRHPMHVSVCDIEYDHDRDALEITQRIFIDDLETSIRKQLNEPDMDITKPGKDRTTDDLVEPYLRQHFSVTVNGKQLAYQYLGHEVENDGLYCYVEIDNVRDLKSIRVFSDILTADFDDQVNIIHVKVDDEIRNMKLTSSTKSDRLEYNE